MATNPVNGLNAKNIDYAQPGQGAAWVGANTSNVIGSLGTLWGQRTQKAGGSQEIFNNFQNWFNHDYQARMDKGWAATTTDQALQNYFKTGSTQGIDPGYALLGFDKAVRGTGQHQQNKQPSFLEGLFTNVLPEIALGAIPGVGPALAAAYGGIKGGLDSGSFLGGLTGALGGYAGGGIGQGLGATFSASGGLSGLLSDPASFLGNVGANAWDGISNVGSSISNAFTHPGSLFASGSSPISFPGFVGSGTPGASSAGIGSSLGNMLFGGGGGSAGGSGMADSGGFFSSLLGNGGLGNLLSTGINYFGQQNYIDAIKQAGQAAKYQPYNISTPGGTVNFDGTNVTSNLSPEFQQALIQAALARNQSAQDLLKFNTGDYANNYYSQIKSLQAPQDAWQSNDFMDKVYNSGNMGSTTGAHDIFGFGLQKALEDVGLRNTALTNAGAEQTRLFNNYFASIGNEGKIATMNTSDIGLGGNLGSQQSGAAQYPWLSANNAANASASFWASLGKTATNIGSSLYSKYGEPGTPEPSNSNLGIGVPSNNWAWGNLSANGLFPMSGALSPYINTTGGQ